MSPVQFNPLQSIRKADMKKKHPFVRTSLHRRRPERCRRQIASGPNHSARQKSAFSSPPKKNNSERRQKNRYYATNAKRNRRDTCLATTGDSPPKNKNGSGYAGTTIYTGTSRGLSYSAHAPALGGRGGHLIDRRTPTRTRSGGQHEKDTKRQKRSLVDDSEHRTTPLAGSHRSRPLSSASDHYTWHSSSWFGGEPRNKKVQIKCRRFAFKSGSVLCERRAAEGDVVTVALYAA